MAIDVEQLEELLLGPALALVKRELVGAESTPAGASSLPVVVFDRSRESMALSEGGAPSEPQLCGGPITADDPKNGMRAEKTPHADALAVAPDLTDADVRRYLEELGAAAQTLTSLNLEKCERVTDVGVSAVVAGCAQLTSLNLLYCNQVTDVGVSAVQQTHPQLSIVTYGTEV